MALELDAFGQARQQHRVASESLNPAAPGLGSLSLARRRFLFGVAALSVVGKDADAGPRVLSLSQLLTRADAVLAVQAERAAAEWRLIFGAERIVTSVQLRAFRQFTPPVASSGLLTTGRFPVSILGGQVGGLSQRVLHAPQLALGGSSLVFLVAEQGIAWVLGMDQGAYALRPDSKGRPRVVLQSEQRAYAEVQGSAAQLLEGQDLEGIAQVLERSRGC